MNMDALVALCKRRGFLFQSSEIYGGINGFWDYGPLGVELKRNIREAWWYDNVTSHNELVVPPGAPSAFQMVGIDSTIIMHPQVWKCSGHYDLFHDYMVDCRETKKRYRYDQVQGRWVEYNGQRIFVTTEAVGDEALADVEHKALRFFNLRSKEADRLVWHSPLVSLTTVEDFSQVLAPDAKTLGTLTPPREFNLMFKTYVGALSGEENVAFLRPETAQGIFVNFKNVLDSTRVKIPFGIAQVGKSFRNEITPRYFTFRSREFEQMEIEFFCRPETSRAWYEYWRQRRFNWYISLGLASERLRLRDHSPDELSHYSCGTADVEYAFPFLAPGDFGELEGIAHRGDFDLRSHMEGKLIRKGNELVVELGPDGQPKYRGSGKDLTYFDEETRERFIPHVIEPSAGADRAALAFLCEAYAEDMVPDEKGVPTKRVVLRLHPRLAPIKVAVFPLVKKDGMPEIAQRIYADLKPHFNCFYDEKGAVGRRYRRQDEIGTPYCITVDSQTLQDDTVTVRDRDSLRQWRIKADDCVEVIRGLIRGTYVVPE
ncbi:Glycyl-tRNA synthetase [Thermogutta terrifontis]|jgi:glycyl-tRNA synthetase|uniref:Glycine--tRNA ligase n=2 Tax=Thermogutta terrifontis TaxID=1331910 RepID=A0A286RFA3_9BACT|nr:Glycyl-tRNA synthetase [Thermogutta terrifontis]